MKKHPYGAIRHKDHIGQIIALWLPNPNNETDTAFMFFSKRHDIDRWSFEPDGEQQASAAELMFTGMVTTSSAATCEPEQLTDHTINELVGAFSGKQELIDEIRSFLFKIQSYQVHCA